MANPGEDRRLRRLSSLCLALPEAEHTRCGAHADFRIRGKVFAYYLRNYQGDGITAVCFKTALGEHVERVKHDPGRFYLPRCIGLRGWFGLRLDPADINWDEIAAMAAHSYDLVAPPELRKPVDPLRFIPPRPWQAPATPPAGMPTRPTARIQPAAPLRSRGP